MKLFGLKWIVAKKEADELKASERESQLSNALAKAIAEKDEITKDYDSVLNRYKAVRMDLEDEREVC